MPTFCGAMNLKHKGLVPFCNFNFNSFCVIDGKLYAASVDGLFRIGGPDDDGAPINWFFETPVSGWGNEREKRVRFAMLAGEVHGKAMIEVVDRLDTTLGAEEVDGAGVGQNPGVFRATFGRKTSARYFKFRVSGVGGSFAAIDGLAAYFISRPHGTSKNS